jgi:uncharacterized membrane protein
MKHYALLYGITILTILPLEFLFLGVIAKGFFQHHVGPMMGDLQALPAILFYLIYSAAIVIFVTANGTSLPNVLLFGAALGFAAYATFDLTMLSIIRGWAWPVALVDMAWGTFLTAVASGVSWQLTRLILR